LKYGILKITVRRIPRQKLARVPIIKYSLSSLSENLVMDSPTTINPDGSYIFSTFKISYVFSCIQ
jgi:hypothetical protein